MMIRLHVTEAAAERIRKLVGRKDRTARCFRIAVDGGGCAGYRYQFSLADNPLADDMVVRAPLGSAILIDPLSAPFLQNCTLDFADELIGASFKVHNPAASGSCGCGVSFSL